MRKAKEKEKIYSLFTVTCTVTTRVRQQGMYSTVTYFDDLIEAVQD